MEDRIYPSGSRKTNPTTKNTYNSMMIFYATKR
jgi:hypothetical protein